jgi:hypothetical protein
MLFLREVPLRNQSGIEALAAELAAEAGESPRSRVEERNISGIHEVVPMPAVPTPPVMAADQAGVDQRLGPVIYGQVTASGHAPIAGATLTLTDLSGRQLDRDQSDACGQYQLGPPSGGSYLVTCAVTAHQPGIALVVVADVPVRHDFVLEGAGSSLSGTVHITGAGQALGGAVVTLIDLRGDVVVTTTTGADGRFSFPGLAQGLYTLTVAATAVHPVARGVEVPGYGEVTYDIELVARAQLVGSVRTASVGAPVPEALTTLLDSDGHVVGSAITDMAGDFVFDDLQAGAYTVIATGYPPVATEVHLSPGTPTETVITLQPATVTDAADGNGANNQQQVGRHGHQ